MNARIFAAALALSLIGVASCRSANATPITYTWDAGTSFTLDDGTSATLTGTFTINPPADSLIASNIVLTGGSAPGTYTPLEDDSGEALAWIDSNVDLLDIFFTVNADTAPQELVLSQVLLLLNPSESAAFQTSVSGGAHLDSASPVPEPASLAIFGAGLAALGFARRKRKAS